MKYYTKGDFYFDIDQHNQLRITGPENHLLLGLAIPYDLKPEVISYQLIAEQLEIKVAFETTTLQLPFPLVTDIRTLRSYTETTIPHPTYRELIERRTTDVLPKSFQIQETDDWYNLIFENSYQDETNQTKHYGSIIRVPRQAKLQTDNLSFTVSSRKPLELTIHTLTNIKVSQPLQSPIFEDSSALPAHFFSPFLLELYEESKEHVTHLIQNRKTSSFEYGTLFPRDWIESANLGHDDLSQETIDFMYEASMAYVSETGEGWHEESIGEYKIKIKDTHDPIDRKMIDIETLYIMGVPRVSRRFLSNQENIRKLQAVSHYILNNALEHELISFKRQHPDSEEYHIVGNWRDSVSAFPGQKSPLAPYDVNCVFYPVSLKIIRKYSELFNIEDLETVDQLIVKWEENKRKFRLYHPGDLIGYSLALHGQKHKPIPTAHLDESYDLFYGQPSLEEVVSFAKKIVDPDFFYTPVGPILVAADEDFFTTQLYHGKVIWPKQAAFSVAGLADQFRRGQHENWPQPVMDTITHAIVVTSEACFKGWEDLQAVPELYYYDTATNSARFYTDQTEVEGQMSLIQLWSSVGCRRIMREYAFIKSIAA